MKTKLILFFLFTILGSCQLSLSQGEQTECVGTVGDLVEVQTGGNTIEAALLYIVSGARQCWVTEKTAPDKFNIPQQIATSQITAKKNERVTPDKLQYFLWQLGFFLSSNRPR